MTTRSDRIVQPDHGCEELLGYFRDRIDSLKRHLFPSQHDVRGFKVTVENTRPDIETSDVVSRLGDAIDLIDRYTPHYGRHLRRDFAGILVTRYPCRGAYDPASRTCLVELTFCVNAEISLAAIASTILHEGMHARLHALGSDMDSSDRAREERFCRRAEIEFGSLVPGAEAVVQRAMDALALDDDGVAPRIDPALAARRIAQADHDAAQVSKRRE